jgi:hypothetical protein
VRADVAVTGAVRAVDIAVVVASGQQCDCEQQAGSRSKHRHLPRLDNRRVRCARPFGDVITNGHHVLSRSRPILAALAALRAITTMRPVREVTYGACRWSRA